MADFESKVISSRAVVPTQGSGAGDFGLSTQYRSTGFDAAAAANASRGTGAADQRPASTTTASPLNERVARLLHEKMSDPTTRPTREVQRAIDELFISTSAEPISDLLAIVGPSRILATIDRAELGKQPWILELVSGLTSVRRRR